MAYPDRLHRHQFPNGVLLVADRMPWLQTAAVSIAVPAGARFDPAEWPGLANLSCELAFRETVNLDSRQLVEALDGLGCDYYSNTSVLSTFFGGALPAEDLGRVLEIFADVVRRPRLDSRWLEESRQTCLQEIEASEDDLAGKVMSRLRLEHYGDPWGRRAEGTASSVGSISLEQIRRFVATRYIPAGAIVAVAGQFEFDWLRDHVGALFGDWSGPQADAAATAGSVHEAGAVHLPHASKQTHIGIAWPGLAYSDPEWPLMRSAIGVLSDGLSSRLFREVRERRGLCYAVSASCHAVPGQGACFAYCGTTTEAAQEALEVIVAEIEGLKHGITADELRRLKVQVRSGLIMQQESCRARVATLISDQLLLGRLRAVDELGRQIEAITLDQLNGFLAARDFGPFHLVTLGEHSLELDRAVP